MVKWVVPPEDAERAKAIAPALGIEVVVLKPQERLTLNGIGKACPVRRQAREATRAWPIALRAIKLAAKPSDRGAGDIIARVIGPIGGDAFKKWWKAAFGKDCGCAGRQDKLNALYPL